MRRKDLEFASEYDAALTQGTSWRGAVALLVFGAMIASFAVWAHWAELEEITPGEGKVIPSSKTQLVQSLEGGLIKEVLVRTGARVKKGDILIRIDDTGFAANLGELTAKRLALTAQVIRLRHEAEGNLKDEPNFPAELAAEAPGVVANELQLYEARRSSLDTQLRILAERVEQRSRELSELNASIDRLEQTLGFANEEFALKQPLAESGIVPKTDMIRLNREIAENSGQLSTQRASRPKLEAAIREAREVVTEQEQKYRQEAHAELTRQEPELGIVVETIRAARDRVVRTDIRAPVDGVVNRINTNTVGGVMQAGQVLMEIVPIEGALFVEAKVRPSDIAFVHPGQPAVVKITAYDFSIYGGLEGEVEMISADSVFDEETRENYYLVTVKTLKTQLKGKEEDLPIIPGMVASVDILTGKKTVLDYLLKPIVKARSEALTER